jgi:hypothetical protein
MDEAEIIEIFDEFRANENCPQCGSKLTGGYYDPEEIIKGPSDGVIAERISIQDALTIGNLASLGIALYIECENFGKTCRFREVFYQYYRRKKKEAKK